MKSMERKRIVALRSKDFGYKKISVLTDMFANTVKSDCWTHPLVVADENNCHKLFLFECSDQNDALPPKKYGGDKQ